MAWNAGNFAYSNQKSNTAHNHKVYIVRYHGISIDHNYIETQLLKTIGVKIKINNNSISKYLSKYPGLSSAQCVKTVQPVGWKC